MSSITSSSPVANHAPTRTGRKFTAATPKSSRHIIPSPATWRNRTVGGYYKVILIDVSCGELKSGPVKALKVVPSFVAPPKRKRSNQSPCSSPDHGSHSSSESDLVDFVIVTIPETYSYYADEYMPAIPFGSLTLCKTSSKTSSYSSLIQTPTEEQGSFIQCATPSEKVETMFISTASIAEKLSRTDPYAYRESESDLETHLLTCDIPYTIRLVPQTDPSLYHSLPEFSTLLAKMDAGEVVVNEVDDKESVQEHDAAPQPPVAQIAISIKDRSPVQPTSPEVYPSTAPGICVWYHDDEELSIILELERRREGKWINKAKRFIRRFLPGRSWV